MLQKGPGFPCSPGALEAEKSCPVLNPLSWPQKLIVTLGKGGVGRTSVSAALAMAYAKKGEKVLLVQWSLDDAFGPLFQRPAIGHKEMEVSPSQCPRVWAMNYDPTETIREYFVEHLKMKLLYKIVIENKHVQRLIQAAPGVQELFFLGRLFWLVNLAEKERGWSYDRIIVDAPATGHSLALFTLAPTIASIGLTGPLAYECERVTAMLAEPGTVGTVVVSLAEELPFEETQELVPKLTQTLGRPPLALVVNRSLRQWVSTVPPKTSHNETLNAVANELHKRRLMEDRFLTFGRDVPLIWCPDVFFEPQGPTHVLESLATCLGELP